MVKVVYDWDWAAAEKEFKLALALNPNYAIAHKGYGQFLIYSGRFEEGLSELRRARELDPFSSIILSLNGQALGNSGRYDQAIEALKEVLEMDPGFAPAKKYLHNALLLKYLKEKAYEDALKECLLSDDKIGMGIVYAKTSRSEETRKILDDLQVQYKTNPELSYDISILFFALGERDTGFTWLESALEYKHRSLWLLKISPFFNSVRDNPRFKAILKKVGFE
jgi:tetratricopeptide (TPR) repeat protein